MIAKVLAQLLKKQENIRSKTNELKSIRQNRIVIKALSEMVITLTRCNIG
jgi:hypothetical protein